MSIPKPSYVFIQKQLVEIPEVTIEEEMNKDLEEVEKELKEIKEISKGQAELVFTQKVNLDEIENKTQTVYQNAMAGTQALKQAEALKEDQNHFKLYAGAGAAVGFTIGVVGFVINPIFGAVAMLISSGLGAGVGGYIGLSSNK